MNVDRCFCGSAFWNEYCWKCLLSLQPVGSWDLSSLEKFWNRSLFESFILVLNWFWQIVWSPNRFFLGDGVLVLIPDKNTFSLTLSRLTDPAEDLLFSKSLIKLFWGYLGGLAGADSSLALKGGTSLCCVWCSVSLLVLSCLLMSANDPFVMENLLLHDHESYL